MTTATEEDTYRKGFRVGLAVTPAAALTAITFGVLAEPVLGRAATIAMSLLVFAGSAQFTALSVLAAGGNVGAAVLSGLLMNGRFLPMGVALAPWLRGGPLSRALQGQAVIDSSWALANRGDGRFAPRVMLGATLPQFVGWNAGTIIGAFAGDVLPAAETLGLDAIFPAFFLCLLVDELRSGRHRLAAGLGALLALALLPWAPTGVPIIGAGLAALVGLRR